ncbi:hypothetical protein BGZ96_004032, partial [Linnemannia gamsii]
MEPPLDFPIDTESSGDDTPQHPNPVEQLPKAPKPERIRRTPKNIDPSTFSNEVQKDKAVPVKCCAVCCRLLYPEEYCKLSELHKTEIEEMFVEERQAAARNDDYSGDIEKITHSSSGAQSLITIKETIRFINEHWMYPGDQPDELRDLHIRGEEYLGSYVGTRGLAMLSDDKVKMKPEEKQNILRAWNWLKHYHPLVRQVDVDDPSDLVNASERVFEQEQETAGRRNVNESGFRAYHMGPVDTGGPRTADESNNVDDMPIGILGRNQQLVKYSNPHLLGYLFPTLYPDGQGFYSKNYGGIKRERNQNIQYHN